MNNDHLAGSISLPVPGTAAWYAQLTPETPLDTDNAGVYLGGSERPIGRRKLELWRISGKGPKFITLGRRSVRYLVKDLDEFKDQCKRSNTLEKAV
jgi:hypothetical protein